jgi:hypothetical protein
MPLHEKLCKDEQQKLAKADRQQKLVTAVRKMSDRPASGISVQGLQATELRVYA